MYLPLDEIHVESRQSRTYCFSLPISAGAATGMKGFIKVYNSFFCDLNALPKAFNIADFHNEVQL
jgi:hypothetical protein